MGIQKIAVKIAEDALSKFFQENNVPSKDIVFVVCDDDSARVAAEGIVKYIRTQGYKAELGIASDYKEHQRDIFNNGNKVIIIGNEDVTKDAEKRVPHKNYGDFYGMRYGASDTMCVLYANRGDLESKSNFKVYYNCEMSKNKDFAEQYGLPLCYGERRHTIESQYDLLWVLFAQEDLPQFLSLDKKTAVPQDGRTPKLSADTQDLISSDVELVSQFREEVTAPFYITEDYLQQFCQRQQKFALPSETQDVQSGDVLFNCGGWQIRRLIGRDTIGIFDTQNQCRAVGNEEQILSPILCHIHAQSRIDTLRINNRLEYGVVLAGGGAKGAFQIGVWKWLKEHGGIVTSAVSMTGCAW